MDFFHAFILAIIQGVTEFLPISSSAHLVLLPIIMQWQDQGIVIDIAAHFGSLLAVLFYFRSDIRKLSCAWFDSFTAEKTSEDAQLAWNILWATVPILVVALFVHVYLLELVRNAIVIGSASILFGILLWHADKFGSKTRKAKTLTVIEALLIGVGQAVALIPGASRSGVTITTGMWIGLTRVEAARFSFLLAIPTILMASLYGTYRALGMNVTVDWLMSLIVALSSAVVAFLCIHWFLKFVSRIGMLPFVVYRIILGMVLLFAYL